MYLNQATNFLCRYWKFNGCFPVQCFGLKANNCYYCLCISGEFWLPWNFACKEIICYTVVGFILFQLCKQRFRSAPALSCIFWEDKVLLLALLKFPGSSWMVKFDSLLIVWVVITGYVQIEIMWSIIEGSAGQTLLGWFLEALMKATRGWCESHFKLLLSYECDDLVTKSGENHKEEIGFQWFVSFQQL